MSKNANLDMDDFREIFNNFNIYGILEEMQPFGNGLINNTYRVGVFDGFETDEYIVQRINTNVFTDVEGLMNNIDIVTCHIEKKIQAENGNPSRRTIKMLKNQRGKNYVETANGVFRIYRSIEDAKTFDQPTSLDAVNATGCAFGEFHKQLMDLDATSLVETIPNFHNTEVKYREFCFAVENSFEDRLLETKDIVKFAYDRRDYASLITNRIKKGLPIHATHNDPKFNNILFDDFTGKPTAIIDLDTMMPGPIAYDFGDAIRSACNTASENETDFDKVGLDIDKFSAFTKGYLDSMAGEITEKEIDSLVDGCIAMTYELGLRFLTDYLSGDKYFKTDYPEHNKNRAIVQFALLESMENQRALMRELVIEHSDTAFFALPDEITAAEVEDFIDNEVLDEDVVYEID